MASEEKRPDWMSNISSLVNPDDYLLGRKIDKTFELGQREKAERAKEARIKLLASDKLKLASDPLLELERRKQQLKIEIISNPIKLRQFRERLQRMERDKQTDRAGPQTSSAETTTDQSLIRASGGEHRSGDRSRSGNTQHRSHREAHDKRDRDHKHRSNRHDDEAHSHRRDRGPGLIDRRTSRNHRTYRPTSSAGHHDHSDGQSSRNHRSFSVKESKDAKHRHRHDGHR